MISKEAKELDPIESLLNWANTKKTITVLELQKLMDEPDYIVFYNLIAKMLAEGKLVPVKASGHNGRLPSLFNKYRIIKPSADYSGYLEQIRCLEPTLNISAYLQKPEQYIKHREVIEGLSHYLWYQAQLLSKPMSRKERSFSIWSKEKFIDEQFNFIQEVLMFNGLTTEFLNYYDTPEPFFEYVHNNSKPLTMLILENKDTWFTLRKLMQETGKNTLAGIAVQVLIYGEGNKISKLGALEEYTKEMFGTNILGTERFLYFGDFDPEGIRLFFRTQKANPNLKMRPFAALYRKMLALVENRILPYSPDERRMDVPLQEFMELLGFTGEEQKVEFLEQGKYIPQEIINYQVFAEILE